MIKKIIKKIYSILPVTLQQNIKKNYNKKKYKPLVSKKKFLHALKKYDVISFDIFDTLITRKIYNPDNIFNIIGEVLHINNFKEKRKKAEQLANDKYKHDVNLEEIYECYKQEYQLNQKEVDKIKKMEIALELEFCCPREDMLEIFNEIKNNKKIILTSDMYLEKDTIKAMLDKCGYKDYLELFLSNDVKARKDTGTIWKFVKEKYLGKKIIHIGDNSYSDVELPKKYGICTYKIYSGKELFEKTRIYEYIREKASTFTVNESIFYGYIINKCIFNSPFSSLQLDTIEKVGFTLYAPLMNDFMEYIQNLANEKNILLFLSREGYYLQKLYKDFVKINNVPEYQNEYFLVSRKATKSTLLSNSSEIDSSLNDYFKGNIKSFMKQIFGVVYQEDNFEIELPIDKIKVKKIISKYENEIKYKAKSEKVNYLKYINSILKPNEYKNAYLIDLGYSGSIQLNLSKMLSHNLEGIYLVSSSKVKKYKEDSVLNFKYLATNNDMYLNIYHYSLLLEFFLAAPYGQLLSFDNKGKPVYNDEYLDDSKKEILEKIYSTCLSYMKDIKSIKKYYDFKPNGWDIAFLFNATIENDFIIRDIKDLFEYYDDHSFSEKYNVFKRINRY